ncbi:MAG: methylmalonyl-CoA mutase family protein [Acidobacteriota bacterium]|nr:methylmalonyl-CoA mutase family protein [Acidobacteriota bacterium]MDH3784465.1 methylmalonyl-CoA mutase family protein [Acidobacteriota bacterium]
MPNDDKSRRAEWEAAVRKTLERRPERRDRFETSSGVDVQRLYTADDPPQDAERRAADLGYPGGFPFTRGVQPTMYRGRFWTMRQYSGFGTAEETNRRFRYLLEQGQTGLSAAFDLPTQLGYDSDSPMAVGEVGKVGVAISSLADMEQLLDGIPLERVSTSMTINSTAATLLALYVAVARKQGVAIDRLSGTVQNDLLKEYIARGTYIYPPKASLRITSDMLAWCHAEVPRWNTISISGYHMREAGSTAAQEIAFTLANAIAYCDAALERGMKFEEFGGRLSFFFNGHSNFFEEICKFRAARRLWSTLCRERFGVQRDDLCRLRFHTQTAGSTLTAQQPDVNVVRTATQALSAVLGGTQSLHTNSMDEALGLPTEHAALLALRTQQVIAYETGVCDTIDPLAGSYFVESLTDQLEDQAREYIAKIDEFGGAVAAIERGYQQREIHEAAFRWQKQVESEDAVVVGVNRFRTDDDLRPPVLRIDPALEKDRIQRLAALRSQRDDEAVRTALAEVVRCAGGTDNLMPAILSAVEAYATLGEVADALRREFGTFRESFRF